MAYSITDRALLTKYNRLYQQAYIKHRQEEIEELYHMNCSTMGIDEAMGLSTKVFNICDLSIHIIECKERLQRKIDVFNQANDDVEEALLLIDDIKVYEAISYFQKYGVRRNRNSQHPINKFKKTLAKIHDERIHDDPIEQEAVNVLSDEIQSYIDYEFKVEPVVINWVEIFNHLKGKHLAEQNDFKRRKEVM
ncbi:hypothetical protein [Mammaliicoccus sp. Dog046]|uniref:hypothetical protein n=1 Tax=Mammaliicoccus sp. Dog046 TaxID=3034233 RepID=UPI002B26345E|nr:hypothetical protein [Mammaliicoccus sp. Dog046]WQK85428.1 hypothetical protein P3U32_12605 [Mammaliicoccus sp. Dog046]